MFPKSISSPQNQLPPPESLWAIYFDLTEPIKQQVDYFLKKHTDATQLPLSLTNDITQNLNAQHGQLTPTEVHDGFFYALLQKK